MRAPSDFSAFLSPDHDPGLTVDEVDQWLNDYAQGKEFTVPVMLESCLLLQGSYWRRLVASEFGDDRELFDRLRLQGKSLLATDQVYVDDTRTGYFRDITFLPAAFLTAYTLRHPLTPVRHALTELSCRAEKPNLRHCLPVILHIGHSWGGGLGRWIENYIEADTLHNHLVLRSIGDRTAFGQQIALYSRTEMKVPLRSWILTEPIQSMVTTQYEYLRLMTELIEDFNIESMIISSLIGHSMDVLRSGLPVTYVLHDFFPFCPALYSTFVNPCRSCTPDELGECARSNPLHSYFKLESVQHWLEVRSAFLDLIMDPKISLVSPSQSVASRYMQLAGSLKKKGVKVIEHGLSRSMIDAMSSVRQYSEPGLESRLKIVILGRMTPEKGSRLLDEFIGDIAVFSDVWLLGAGENGQQFARLPNVKVVSDYTTTDLDRHLVSISPHIGLLLSIVPETFSYTLSEMWAAGIPVLATRLGAFSDRVVDGELGWLEEINAERFYNRIKQINIDREAIALVRDRLRQQPIRSAIEMVDDYQLLKTDPSATPIRRYFLPRKTHQSHHHRQIHNVPNTALYIDAKASYRAVLREFLQYSAQKVDQTPRISTVAKEYLIELSISVCVFHRRKKRRTWLSFAF
ncbi:MAG: glycosyltransferase [Haliea sp.]|nr:glycosyltransferase [Haliea sp.]